jgi:hypothetical protein
MNINLNLNKLICNCSGKTKQNDQEEIEKLIMSCEKIAELSQGVVAFDMYLGKILNFVNGSYGFINKAVSNGVITYTNLAIHGISINDKMMMQRFFNIPMFYCDAFVGAMGFGGDKLNTKRVELIKPLIDIISKELYKYNKH